MTDASFNCSVCGKPHAGLPTDRAYTLPDVVWALAENERAALATWDTDLCQMGEQNFIRCVLPIRFTEQEGYFGWGVWVQVERPVFERYLQVYEQDATTEPEAEGTLANQLPLYESTLGARVLVKFGLSTKRPTVRFPEGSANLLATEQAHGIGAKRYHQILEAVRAVQP